MLLAGSIDLLPIAQLEMRLSIHDDIAIAVQRFRRISGH